MIHVQEYLQAGGTLETLLADHAVHSRPHRGKVSFLYDQIGAKTDNPLANQCRGLILREHTWELVAYPFGRFFNHGQGCATDIDWKTARFEEKLDGSLVIAYFDEPAGRWFGATRQMCEAQGNVDGVGTFAELIDKAAQEHGAADFHALMSERCADKSATYCFELTSPYNRIVCRYDSPGLTLLGVRSLVTHRETDPAPEAVALGVRAPRSWHFDNIEHLTEVMRDWHPTEYEGVVVKDARFNRIKVKTPQYLAVHHAKDGLGTSWRSVCEAVSRGLADDIAPLVPDWIRERIETVQGGLADVMAATERDYAELRGIDDMKTYALAAQSRAWPAALFAMKRGKTESLDAFVAKANPDSLVSLVATVRPEVGA